MEVLALSRPAHGTVHSTGLSPEDGILAECYPTTAMNPIPDQLVEGLSHTDTDAARRWWSLLAEGERADLSDLYDSRRDSCRVVSKRITILVDSGLICDHEVETDDLADYFDYVLGHPEDYPPFDPFFRTFHICLDPRHAALRSVEAASATVVCPFNSPVCPFRR